MIDRIAKLLPILSVSVLGLLFCVSSIAAQQQDAQPPSSSQQPQPKTQDPKDDKDKQDDKTGKSKLERETGTVNDRIFEVLPNCGTVESAKDLPPLTTGQKFRIATAGVFDWGAYPFNAALSAIAQARNDPKEWGQGWDTYGKRFG